MYILWIYAFFFSDDKCLLFTDLGGEGSPKAEIVWFFLSFVMRGLPLVSLKISENIFKSRHHQFKSSVESGKKEKQEPERIYLRAEVHETVMLFATCCLL